MDQSPAAFFYQADATDNGDRGATGVRGFGHFSVEFPLLTGSGGGGENLLPTCVLCHVSRSTDAAPRPPPPGDTLTRSGLSLSLLAVLAGRGACGGSRPRCYSGACATARGAAGGLGGPTLHRI